MSKLNDRISELYEEFRNISLRPKIVRDGHFSDAFTLVVLETLFHDFHSIQNLTSLEHIELIERNIVPPPDDSIDIFFEELLLDERKYHIVQVKDQNLAPDDIETCFLKMKHAIDTFIESRKETRTNLRKVLSKTDFGEQYKNNCIYYVVHRGKTEQIRNQKDNQIIINEEKLISLRNGIIDKSVPYRTFEIDTANNFILQNFVDGKHTIVNNNLPKSLLCNFSGYDLAKLDKEYSDTDLGRNILYGGNLRESLNKKAKTFESMIQTINNEPELFLYYNNGITILSDFIDAGSDEYTKGKENIILRSFSIINGAQTTSTLGAYLKDAERNGETNKIENLKKVFVLTKIYEINSKLNNHTKISEKIKLYNNTQTPLSSRDMVSIRREQKLLQKNLIEGDAPQIFVYIKKGENLPKTLRLFKHQEVTNETLAQLALCGFFLEPYNAKDKKVKIFDNEGKDETLLNPIYNKLFNEKDGVLFLKSKKEIDELLFIYRLHEDTKTSYKKSLNEQISNLSQSVLQEGYTNEDREREIAGMKRNLDIANNCLFYNITCYFKFRQRFDYKVSNIKLLNFDTKKYYEDKSFKGKLIDSFSRLFFSKTIEIIRRKSEGENVTNWVRSETNEKAFLDALTHYFSDQFSLPNDYADFVNTFKVQSI